MAAVSELRFAFGVGWVFFGCKTVGWHNCNIKVKYGTGKKKKGVRGGRAGRRIRGKKLIEFGSGSL